MNIKELRKYCGLTQKEFANKFKIPMRSIQNWEEGQSKPPAYIPRLIELNLILENEINEIKSGQLTLIEEEE